MLDPRDAPDQPVQPPCPFCHAPMRVKKVWNANEGREIVMAQCVACQIAGFGKTVAEAADFGKAR